MNTRSANFYLKLLVLHCFLVKATFPEYRVLYSLVELADKLHNFMMKKTYSIIGFLLCTALTNGCQHTSEISDNALEIKQEANLQIASQLQQILQLPNNDNMIIALKKLNHQFPNNAMIHSAMGYCLSQQNRDKDAQKYYQQSINIEPKRPEWRNNLGTFLCQKNYFSQGIKILNQASEQANSDEKTMIAFNIQHCQQLKNLAALHHTS